jgi:hypothetical protein
MQDGESAIVRKLQKQMRLLQAYLVASSLIFAAIMLMALKRPERNAKFGTINVQRINVREPDGTLRLAIFNNALSPANGLATTAGHRGAGLMFYGDDGSEIGGLTYTAQKVNGQTQADSSITFDQYQQDQVVGLTQKQYGTERAAGLKVWSRPNAPLTNLVGRMNALSKMPEGSQKAAAMKKFHAEIASGAFGATRVFVGRNTKNDATIMLADNTGKPRIVMSVAADGTAHLNFLDAKGKVIDSLPHKAAGEH